MKYHHFLLFFMFIAWVIEECLLLKIKSSLNKQKVNKTSVLEKIEQHVRWKFIKIKVEDEKINKLILYYNLSFLLFIITLLLLVSVRIFKIWLR